MCEFEFTVENQRNLQKASHILNLMDEISKVFFTESEQRKVNFPFRKTKFGTHWGFCVYHRIFGLQKGPTGQTISKGKSVYN